MLNPERHERELTAANVNAFSLRPAD